MITHYFHSTVDIIINRRCRLMFGMKFHHEMNEMEIKKRVKVNRRVKRDEEGKEEKS